MAGPSNPLCTVPKPLPEEKEGSYPFCRLSALQTEQLAENHRVWENVDELKKLLQSSRAFTPMSVICYKDLLPYTVSNDVVNRRGNKLSLPFKVGGGVGRPRSYDSRVRAAFEKLARGFDVGFPSALRPSIVEKCADTLFVVNPCPDQSFGRLSAVRSTPPTLPPTMFEVERALWLVGQTVVEKITPRQFDPGDPARAIKVNASARAGLPTLGRKEGVPLERSLDIAHAFRRNLAGKSLDEVRDALRRVADSHPELVTAIAVAKEDYYSPKKYVENKLRLYTIVPFGLQLAMAPATQAYEAQCENSVGATFEGYPSVVPGAGVGERLRYPTFQQGWLGRPRGFNSAQGVSFQYQGAHKLFAPHALYVAVSKKPTYACCGDDIFMFVPFGASVLKFKIDCTSYDLTQCWEVLYPVILGMHSEMRKIDEVGASVWASYYMERNLLLGQSVVRTRDMGPSGTSLQSKVNNVLACILCERIVESIAPLLESGMDLLKSETLPALKSEGIEDNISKIVVREGAKLGLITRIERLTVDLVWGSGGSQYLRRFFASPTIFLGYEIYYCDRLGLVVPFVDLARCLAQAQYPKKSFNKQGQEAEDQIYCVIRLAQLLSNLGVPPSAEFLALEKREEARQLMLAVENARQHVLRMARRVVEKFPTLSEERMVDDNFYELSQTHPESAQTVSACVVQLESPRWEGLWVDPKETVVLPVVDVALPPKKEGARVAVQMYGDSSSRPVQSWRSLGRQAPRPIEVPVEARADALSTARGRRKEHRLAGEHYLQSNVAAIEEDDDDALLPPQKGRRRGRK